jgi:hypothetical protein
MMSAQDGEIQWIPLDAPQLSRSEVQWLDAITRFADEPLYSEAIGFMEDQVYNGEVSSADRAAVQLLERVALSPYSEQYTGPRPATAPGSPQTARRRPPGLHRRGVQPGFPGPDNRHRN